MGSTRSKARRLRLKARRRAARAQKHRSHRRTQTASSRRHKPRSQRRTHTETPQPEPVAEPREVRVRLDDADRALILAGLQQLLPEQVRKDGNAFHKLHYRRQKTLRPIRLLIHRLQAPRRGHPSTW